MNENSTLSAILFFKKSFPFELIYSNGKLLIKKYCTQPMKRHGGLFEGGGLFVKNDF